MLLKEGLRASPFGRALVYPFPIGQVTSYLALLISWLSDFVPAPIKSFYDPSPYRAWIFDPLPAPNDTASNDPSPCRA